MSKENDSVCTILFGLDIYLEEGFVQVQLRYWNDGCVYDNAKNL